MTAATVFHLSFRFSTRPGGQLTGSMDSPDQGARNLPMGDVSLQGRVVSLAVPSVGGLYHGTLNPGGKSMAGTWGQLGQSMALNLRKVSSSSAPPAVPARRRPGGGKGIAGDWRGILKFGGTALHVLFHFDPGPGGRLTGSMDSPDQGAMGIPLSEITFANRTLRTRAAGIGGSVQGTLNASGSTISATWLQGPTSIPLTLKRG